MGRSRRNRSKHERKKAHIPPQQRLHEENASQQVLTTAATPQSKIQPQAGHTKRPLPSTGAEDGDNLKAYAKRQCTLGEWPVMLDDKIALVKQDVAAMVEELEHTKEELRTEKTKNAKLCREVFDLNADIAGLMEEAESDAQLADLEEANEILADEIAGLAKEKDALADKIELLESELYKWKSRARANKMAKKELGKIQRQWKYILSTLGDDVKEWESETDSDLDSD